MILTADCILETIFNPKERFKSIANLETYALDHSVVRSYLAGVLEVDVVIDHQRWILSCNVDTNKSVGRDVRNLISELAGVDKSLLNAVEFFEAEMLVFDSDARCYELDITLRPMVEGVSLAQKLIETYASRDAVLFDRLRERYCHLLCSFIDGAHAEFKLRPSDIMVVGADSLLKVVSYRAGVHTAKDHIAYALMLLIMRSNLPLKVPFRSMNVFASHILRHYIPTLKRIALEQKLVSLAQACEFLSEKTSPVPDSKLCDLLRDLLSMTINVDCLDDWQVGSDTKPNILSLDKLLQEYDYFGRLAEGMIAVEKNNKWGYVNDRVEQCVSLNYDWADDFSADRAIVLQGDSYGLIDPLGQAVIPLIYESLEWDASNSIAVASIDGYFGVLDAFGKVLVEFEYRWIGELSCSLMLAMKDDKYGYINLQGDTVIDFIYDEAYDFRDNKATVVVDGVELELSAC